MNYLTGFLFINFSKIEPLSTSNIEYLTIDTCPPNRLYRLFMLSPQLKYLNIRDMWNDYGRSKLDSISLFAPKVMALSMTIEYYLCDDFHLLLKQFSQLKQLSLKARGEDFTNGRKWENFICSYLPRLEEFRFVCNDILIATTMNQVIESFQTDFWTKQHQWYIVCDFHVDRDETYVYTVPYMFNEFRLCPISTFESKTTVPSSSTLLAHAYDNVQQLCLILSDTLFHRHYSNVETLVLCQVVENETIGHNIQALINLSSVKHLTIDCDIKSTCFLHLLQQTTMSLSSLTFGNSCPLLTLTSKFSDRAICEYLNQRITSLNLSHYTFSDDCMKQFYCVFSHLQQLHIWIYKWYDLIELLNEMKHLTCATISCEEKFNVGEDIHKWLKERTRLKNFTYQFDNYSMKLWIGSV
ncbi:unnamed protein product [Didymodactylos carnosus]|uniref:Uncharacterized protein n=1 Tax=Didymodactylos carnosus TaxID=1234261 RepID=A0A814NCW3_9BILA|nr:unnamed protein product [Didymodactylos carnosus]CAF1202360.1 unnamed protein product [Didymodactylos carnosus]CAF3856006.1 unnamed protein product [Didymodactylos carnosus]CAF4012132.1 unnamed protein product [Didymodactylos carnosus]